MPRPLRTTLVALLALCALLTVVACTRHILHSDADPIPERPQGALRLASYNVHYILLNQPAGAWSVADWDRRKGPMDAAFKAIAPDIIAFQEMESFARGNDGATNLTLDHLLENNPEYAAAAVGDWREFPSTQPILYRRAAFDVTEQGWFFFSDTPDVIYARTFNGSYPAFASWARFAPRSGGRAFIVMNVHFEYKSRSNRLLSAELVKRRLEPMLATGTPVILMGDINARRGARTADILEETGLRLTEVPGATYHFNRGLNLFGAIDHIALPPAATLVQGPFVVQRRFLGEWPSDHYPVVADITLP